MPRRSCEKRRASWGSKSAHRSSSGSKAPLLNPRQELKEMASGKPKASAPDVSALDPPPSYEAAVGSGMAASPLSTHYVNISAGEQKSYFVRSDGKVDQSSMGRTTGTLSPPDGVKYVQASAGTANTYLLRDDGVIDRVQGRVVGSIVPTSVCTSLH